MDENIAELFEDAVMAYVEQMSEEKLVEIYLNDVSNRDLVHHARFTIFHSHNSSEQEMKDFIESFGKKE